MISSWEHIHRLVANKGVAAAAKHFAVPGGSGGVAGDIDYLLGGHFKDGVKGF